MNNFIPHSAVAAFGMAKLLASKFDRYLAVAPEGHIYGYFFERLGVAERALDQMEWKSLEAEFEAFFESLLRG
ncbi:hypothetical protein [Geomonas sp. Red276]